MQNYYVVVVVIIEEKCAAATDKGVATQKWRAKFMIPCKPLSIRMHKVKPWATWKRKNLVSAGNKGREAKRAPRNPPVSRKLTTTLLVILFAIHTHRNLYDQTRAFVIITLDHPRLPVPSALTRCLGCFWNSSDRRPFPSLCLQETVDAENSMGRVQFGLDRL